MPYRTSASRQIAALTLMISPPLTVAEIPLGQSIPKGERVAAPPQSG